MAVNRKVELSFRFRMSFNISLRPPKPSGDENRIFQNRRFSTFFQGYICKAKNSKIVDFEKFDFRSQKA